MPREDAARLPVPHAQPYKVSDKHPAVFPDYRGNLGAVRPVVDVPAPVPVSPSEHQLLASKAGRHLGVQLRPADFNGNHVIGFHALHGTDNLEALVRHRTGRKRAAARARHELARDPIPEAHDAVAALHGDVVEELVAVRIVETHV